MPAASSHSKGDFSKPIAALIGLRVIAGAALIIAPGTVLGDLPHQEIKAPARAFARILGVRHLVEAAVLTRDHTHRWVLLGAGVDAIHAVTMVAVAVARPDERRLALSNAVTASTLAGAGVMASRYDTPR